jgi:hypothetical protein
MSFFLMNQNSIFLAQMGGNNTILLEKEWIASFGPICATYCQIWKNYYGLEIHELGGSWQLLFHYRDYG